MDTPSGGTGPSPKRQRTHEADGQDRPEPSNGSLNDRTENGPERPATADAAHEAETEGGPQLSESFDNMTETVKAGMFMIHSRAQAADAKVFEELKQQFIQKMQGVKIELHNYYQNQTTEWAGTSTSTTELAARLRHAKQLVQGLGLQAISN
ncbi:hypothetical protein ABBQ32_002202 [Trebouxia sp. C0010 RCD-2024]